jgi:hypothetical protein
MAFLGKHSLQWSNHSKKRTVMLEVETLDCVSKDKVNHFFGVFMPKL